MSTREIIKVSRECTERTLLSCSARASLELVPRPGWLKLVTSSPIKSPVLPTPRRENKTAIVETMVVENAHDDRAKVDVIDENQSIETSSAKVDVVHGNESNQDEVDKNKCGEASGSTSHEVPKGESDEVPKVCVSAADVEQVTETPEQHLSAALETAEQIVNVPDDAD